MPPWIDPDGTNFFVTICCKRRGANRLCLPDVGDGILSAARFYHEQRRWLLTLSLVMPDHMHMLVSFGREKGMIPVVSAWKRYLSNQRGIVWQTNLFDHRPRTEAYISREAHYILQNPVRAGLVQTAQEWPWVWTPD